MLPSGRYLLLAGRRLPAPPLDDRFAPAGVPGIPLTSKALIIEPRGLPSPAWRFRADPVRDGQANLPGKSLERPARKAERPLRHQARLDHGRDEAQLSRLRDERDRQPRAARRARRPEAGASAHPVLDVRAEFHARAPLQQMRAHHRRHDRPIPSARRHRRLRRDGAHGAGFLDARAADRRAGQFRLRRRRPAGGLAIHRGAAAKSSR